MRYEMSDKEFLQFKTFIFEIAGIDLDPSKKAMLTARLSKRLNHFKLRSFSAYFNLLKDPAYVQEKQVLVDLLTTNETYFFREPEHLTFLKDTVLEDWQRGQKYRVWSAASSTGQEAYGVAMVLSDFLGKADWEIVGSDLNSEVVATANSGHYPLTRIKRIPKNYLRKYCLKGSGPYEGTLLINAKLRQRVNFRQVNLNTDLPDLGLFDVIFLKNVLFYFNQETKREVVRRVLAYLKPNGYFFIGHSETLKGIDDTLKPVGPTVYQKSEASEYHVSHSKIEAIPA